MTNKKDEHKGLRLMKIPDYGKSIAKARENLKENSLAKGLTVPVIAAPENVNAPVRMQTEDIKNHRPADDPGCQQSGLLFTKEEEKTLKFSKYI